MIIEKILHETDRLRVGGSEFVDMHRLMINVTRMKKFDAERQAISGPKRAIMAEFNLAEFIVVEIFRAQDRG